jgi:CRISPR-associated protein Csm3
VRAVLDVLGDDERGLLARLTEGMRLLEDDALGGGGSRGSGRVSFSSLRLVWRSKAFYASGAAETELVAGADLAQLQQLANEEGFAERLN